MALTSESHSSSANGQPNGRCSRSLGECASLVWLRLKSGVANAAATIPGVDGNSRIVKPVMALVYRLKFLRNSPCWKDLTGIVLRAPDVQRIDNPKIPRITPQ